MTEGDERCLGFTSVAVIKCPDLKLREKGFILGHSPRSQSIRAERSRNFRPVTAHPQSGAERNEGVHACLLACSVLS